MSDERKPLTLATIKTVIATLAVSPSVYTCVLDPAAAAALAHNEERKLRRRQYMARKKRRGWA